MTVWRIEPFARPDDPRWQDRPVFEEVIVRAETAAEARLFAARLEIDPDQPPVGNESLTFKSGFEDEALYRVRRLPDGEAPADAADSGDPILRAVRLRPPERP